jgi:Pyruvate/2-oxoacid:ferredoxin oxidoreductase delta subunit
MLRRIIEIDEALCNGCGQCVPSCAEGAIEIVDNKARLIGDKYCDGLGACIGECPEGALKIVEREAEDFDVQAVHEHIENKSKDSSPKEVSLPCGCPSTQMRSFNQREQLKSTPVSESHSALMHWPVKIRLIAPTVPFLKDADIVVAADCSPVACGNFHRNYLENKVIMIGCPKFDDMDIYRNKFIEIFKKSGIKSVTTISMEVPCCSGLPSVVKEALRSTGKPIPLEEIVISIRGEVLKKEKAAA